jgi:hypothetical protein
MIPTPRDNQYLKISIQPNKIDISNIQSRKLMNSVFLFGYLKMRNDFLTSKFLMLNTTISFDFDVSSFALNSIFL